MCYLYEPHRRQTEKLLLKQTRKIYPHSKGILIYPFIMIPSKCSRRVFCILLSCMALAVAPVAAFLAPFSGPTQSSGLARKINSNREGTIQLDLAKRRGKLGSLVDAGESVAKTTRTVPKKRSKRAPKKKAAVSSSSSSKKDASSTISPLLQEWASTGDVEKDDDEVIESSSSSSSTGVAQFEDFELDDKSSKKNKKSGTKSAKQSVDTQRRDLVTGLVEQVKEVLEESSENNKKTADMNDILGPLRQLLALPNANNNLRQVLAGTNRNDYRLTWVGSDAAICHIGTGLHKVPLARLQEVFLSCIGKSRLELLEVIRIIGPFPNVRNTLEGAAKISKRGLVYGSADSSSNNNNDGAEKTVTQLSITYDSMIDGTGKQLTAGMDDNVRTLDVHIAFADEHAIVAVVPGDDGSVREDPFEDNGANILFFAKEEILEGKLEALRVL